MVNQFSFGLRIINLVVIYHARYFIKILRVKEKKIGLVKLNQFKICFDK